MKNLVFCAAFALTCAATPNIAFAQATRTWVSGVGDDVNPCSRTAPCKTFAGAISKTAAGGEINVLDPGGYGTVTVTKSITIASDIANGGILNSATTGVIVNAAATDVVTLRGISFDGGTPSAPGLNGVRVLAAGAVNIVDCNIINNKSAGPNGNGILINNTANKIVVSIVNSTISNNGVGTSGAGIQIAPTGTGSVAVSIRNSSILSNARGITVDTTGTTGSVTSSVNSSVILGNPLAGVLLVSNGATSTMTFSESISSNNFGGLGVNGAGTKLTFGRSTIAQNTNGLLAANGGQLVSSGGNIVTDNVNQGAPTSTIPPL